MRSEPAWRAELERLLALDQPGGLAAEHAAHLLFVEPEL